MKLFNDYKEAVISNGSVIGVYKYENTSKFCHLSDGEPEPISANWKECSPADYLEPLDSFLAHGKRLVSGDSYVEDDGDMVLVSRYGNDNSVAEESASKSMKYDNLRFVLQAAADQVETPEEKEAFDAIDTTPQQVESLASCSEKPNKSKETMILFEHEDFNLSDCLKDYLGKKCKVRYRFVNTWGYEMCAVEFGDGFCHCVVSHCLENPTKREERERMEAAYDLYLTSRNSTNEYTITFNQFCGSMVKVHLLAIVDKTGYRKECKK